MKNNLNALLLAALLLFTTALHAQPPMGPGGQPPPPGEGNVPPPPGVPPLPGLTQEQAEQLRQIEIGTLKKITPLEYSIAELELRLKALLSEAEPKIKGLYGVIEAISELRGNVQKARIEQHLAIQKLLTEEQRLLFDRGFGTPPPRMYGASPRPNCQR